MPPGLPDSESEHLSDVLSTRKLLDEFLDYIESLDEAEADEQVWITENLRKRARTPLLQRYILIQREIDVVDTLVALLTREAIHGKLPGSAPKYELQVASNILGIFQALVNEEDECKMATAENDSTGRDVIFRRNALILFHHQTSLPTHLLNVLNKILLDLRSSASKPEHRRNMADLALDLLLCIFRKMDLQSLSSFGSRKDGYGDECGTEDMLATILWRCTAEALRHVGVDADYCRAMVAMLSKLMELCDMIGSRIYENIGSLALAHLLRCRMPPFPMKENGNEIYQMRTLLTIGLTELRRYPISAQTITRGLDRAQGWIVVATFVIETIQRRQSISLSVSQATYSPMSDVLASLILLRSMHMNSSTVSHVYCNFPPDIKPLISKMESIITSYCLARIPQLLANLVHAYIVLLEEAGKQISTAKEASAEMVHLADELHKIAGQELDGRMQWDIPTQTWEEILAFVTLALSIMSKFLMLAAPSEGISTSEGILSWEGDSTNRRIGPSVSTKHIYGRIVRFAACAVRIADIQVGVAGKMKEKEDLRRHAAVFNAISQQCQATMIRLFKEPDKWILIPCFITFWAESVRQEKHANVSEEDGTAPVGDALDIAHKATDTDTFSKSTVLPALAATPGHSNLVVSRCLLPRPQLKLECPSGESAYSVSLNAVLTSVTSAIRSYNIRAPDSKRRRPRSAISSTTTGAESKVKSKSAYAVERAGEEEIRDVDLGRFLENDLSDLITALQRIIFRTPSSLTEIITPHLQYLCSNIIPSVVPVLASPLTATKPVKNHRLEPIYVGNLSRKPFARMISAPTPPDTPPPLVDGRSIPLRKISIRSST